MKKSSSSSRSGSSSRRDDAKSSSKSSSSSSSSRRQRLDVPDSDGHSSSRRSSSGERRSSASGSRERDRSRDKEREGSSGTERRSRREHGSQERSKDRSKERSKDRSKERSSRDGSASSSSRRPSSGRSLPRSPASSRRSGSGSGSGRSRTDDKKRPSGSSSSRPSSSRPSSSRRARAADADADGDADADRAAREREARLMASLDQATREATGLGLDEFERPVSSKARTRASHAPAASSPLVPRKSKSSAKASTTAADSGDDDQYEDDFEDDYEDDFEDEEDFDDDDGGEEDGDGVLADDDEMFREPLSKEMENIRAAMAAENANVAAASPGRVGSAAQQPAPAPARAQPSPPPREPEIDPAAAGTVRMDFAQAKKKTKSKAASKSMRRAADLARIIDLDVVTFNLFDMAPMTEYEIYIRNYGKSGTRQAGAQTQEDNGEREIQTEEIETRERWTQHPPTDMRGYGRNEDEPLTLEEEEALDNERRDLDTTRLGEFIARAAPVCLVLLEENSRAQLGPRGQETRLSCSDSKLRLASTMPLLAGRKVVGLAMNPANPALLLTAYAAPPADVRTADAVRMRGVLGVWSTMEPSLPQKLLTLASSPTCCCFGSANGTMACVGTVDGGVLIFDLREPSTLHRLHDIGGMDFILRSPSYSTEGIGAAQNHTAEIVAIEAIGGGRRTGAVAAAGAAGSGGEGGGGGGGGGDPAREADQPSTTASLFSTPLQSDTSEGGVPSTSFQLATLDRDGVLKVWTVIEVSKADVAGSTRDLGLLPGSRIKLVPSATIHMDMIVPDHPSRVVVGADKGRIVHAVRFGARKTPRMFRSKRDSIASRCVTLAFSPFLPQYFLAGWDDGEVGLYRADVAQPVLEVLQVDGGVRWAGWSPTRPGVFFVVDAANQLHSFDLLEKVRAPVACEALEMSSVSAVQIVPPTSASTTCSLVVASEDGVVVFHLSRAWCAPQVEELESVSYLLDTVDM